MPRKRYRIGVIFAPSEKLNAAATTFLILQLNKCQEILEFEVVPAFSSDPLWRVLRRNVLVDRKVIEKAAADFRSRYASYWEAALRNSIANETPPPYLVIVSTALFADYLYSTTLGGISVLALSNWRRYMAPPSLVEFVVFLVLRLAMGLIDPSIREWQHLGTKGCLWDYNPRLADVRHKILVGYICDDCTVRIRQGPLAELAGPLQYIVNRGWLGKRDDPQSVAAISAKLGYDLFTATGARPTLRETLLSLVRDEGAKESVKWLFAVLLAAALAWLGYAKH